MRFPMAVMESNNIVADQSSFGNTGQFGDMEVIVKAIVVQEDTWTLSAGLGISIPTAPDVNVGLADGTPLAKVANHSTHLQPFFGLLVTPNDDWFAQAYLEIDVAASGDPVSANLTGNGLTSVGDDQRSDADLCRRLDRTLAVPQSVQTALRSCGSRRSALHGRPQRAFGRSGRELPDRRQLGSVQCPGSHRRCPCGRWQAQPLPWVTRLPSPRIGV